MIVKKYKTAIHNTRNILGLLIVILFLLNHIEFINIINLIVCIIMFRSGNIMTDGVKFQISVDDF